MSQFLFLRGARQIVTMRGPAGLRRGDQLQDIGLLPESSLLLENGRIAAIGSTRRLENLKAARNAIEIPIHGKIVLPGLVDPNLHLTLQRSPTTSQKPRRTAEFYDDTLNLLRACLHHGTLAARVCTAADTGNLRTDVSLLRALHKIGDQQIRVSRAWRVRPEAADFGPVLDLVLKRKLAHVAAVAVDAGLSNPALPLRKLQLGGLPVHLVWGGGPPRNLQHCLERLRPSSVSSDEPFTSEVAEMIRDSGAIAILSAGRRVIAGDTHPALRHFIEAGGAVALSSGYHSAYAPMFNLQVAVAVAVARLGLTLEQALTAVTVNAAFAAGCESLVGTLEVGRPADLAVLSLPDYRELPEHFGVNNTVMVLRAGNIVFNRTRWRAPVEPADRMRRKLL